MKKRIINAVLIICTLILVALVAGVVTLNIKYGDEKETTGSVQVNAEDYLKLHATQTAQKKENALWLIENYDTVFNAEDPRFVSALSGLEDYFFDTVYIRAKAFYKAKDVAADYGEHTARLTGVINAIKAKGKKCAVVFDNSFLTEDFLPLFSLSDTIVISGMDNETAANINKTVVSFKKTLKEKNITGKIQLILSKDYEQKQKIDFKSINSVYLSVMSENESHKIRQWNELMKDTSCTVTAGFYFTDNNKPSDVLSLVRYTDTKNIASSRCFSSLKAVTENKNNCFGAVNQYITRGIIPELALRKLDVVGYNGETLQTNESTVQITVTGSNLFPIESGGEKYYTDDTGSKKITLQLNEGENIFRFVQDGEVFLYRINYTFEGELIESVLPADEIRVSPGEDFEVMVIAYSKSEVTVKLGAEQFQAEPEEKNRPCYTAFTAKIRMPSSYEELASVGSITVIATHNGSSVQKKGAVIKASEGVTVPTTVQNQQTTLKIENYTPEIPLTGVTAGQSVTFEDVTTSFTAPVTVAPQNGSQMRTMAVITSAYADTWRLIENDDTYVPYYTPLCQGTMDYVTAESTAYNSDDEKEVYFYELASGRKVRQENAQLITTGTLNDNKMSVLSTEGENGTIKIKIRTDWKVPYALNYSPQNYFAAYSKLFNVSSFTAESIEFTFYHTASADGSVDTSLSDVVSSAQWSVSSSDKTARLILKLKNPGEYYGSNLSYDSQGNMIITVNNKPKALSGTVVMLDPGHGGTEPGAVGIGSAVLEKDVNYAVAYYTKQALEEMGATVIMTRYGNDTLTLEQRKAIMRQYKPDLFVAIHSNGSYNTEEKGTSTYYFKPFSRSLADNIYEELLSVYKNDVYAGRVELFDKISDGTIYYPFSVTRVEECPSVLIEVGYMTNDEECYELIDSENQKQFGKAIARGIQRTISE